MSKHNRERRMAGKLKARLRRQAGVEQWAANERREDELAFYRAVRQAQAAANQTQEPYTVEHAGHSAQVRPVPQHGEEGWKCRRSRATPSSG